jgi:uncharacterized membrane protein YbaN (DUF454 family)
MLPILVVYTACLNFYTYHMPNFKATVQNKPLLYKKMQTLQNSKLMTQNSQIKEMLNIVSVICFQFTYLYILEMNFLILAKIHNGT